MKYLDTYETWNKVFKLVRTEDDDFFKMYIHNNNWTTNTMEIASFSEEELSGLAEFIQNFLSNDNHP